MIKIYEKEVLDGLEDKIKANASIAYLTKVEKKYNQKVDDGQIQKMVANVAGANPNQLDLYYMYSILVSVAWNKNDDVFTDEEVWKAKSSPVSKPFNYMHDDKYIIGNITSSFAVDHEGNIIEDDDERPESYDIVIGSVIYRCWDDEERAEIVKEVIEKSEAGEGFVSMECLFNDFDYALTKGEERKIIARTEESSFLTKHLRAYEGSGEYEGYKIGRAVKNVIFSGVGFVDKPANERSIIFNNENPFTGAAKASVEIFEGEEESMADTPKKDEGREEIKIVSETLNSQIDSLKAENKELVTESAEAKQAHAAELKAKDEEIESLKASIVAKDEEIAKAKEASEAKDKELAEAKEVIAKVEAEKVSAERVSALIKVGADEKEAVETVKAWDGATDEQFGKVVELCAKTYMDKKESDKKAKEKMKKEEEAKAEAEAEEDVDVELEEESAKADFAYDTDETEEDLKKLHSSVAKLMGK